MAKQKTTRTEFTPGDRAYLIKYLARYNPDGKNRSGNVLYKRLVEDPKFSSWSTRHTWEAWRNYYMKNQEELSRRIEKQVAKEKGKTQKEPSPQPSPPPPTSSQRAPFTEEEDAHLVAYLAFEHPRKEGRKGNAIFRQLTDPDHANQWPWAKTHSWQSWREHYTKKADEFDMKITKYQKKHEIDPNDEPSHLTRTTWKPSRERDTKRKRRRSSEEENDERGVEEEGNQGGAEQHEIGPPKKRIRIALRERETSPVRKTPTKEPVTLPPELIKPKSISPAILALRQEEEEESQLLEAPQQGPSRLAELGQSWAKDTTRPMSSPTLPPQDPERKATPEDDEMVDETAPLPSQLPSQLLPSPPPNHSSTAATYNGSGHLPFSQEIPTPSRLRRKIDPFETQKGDHLPEVAQGPTLLTGGSEKLQASSLYAPRQVTITHRQILEQREEERGSGSFDIRGMVAQSSPPRMRSNHTVSPPSPGISGHRSKPKIMNTHSNEVHTSKNIAEAEEEEYPFETNVDVEDDETPERPLETSVDVIGGGAAEYPPETNAGNWPPQRPNRLGGKEAMPLSSQDMSRSMGDTRTHPLQRHPFSQPTQPPLPQPIASSSRVQLDGQSHHYLFSQPTEAGPLPPAPPNTLATTYTQQKLEVRIADQDRVHHSTSQDGVSLLRPEPAASTAPSLEATGPPTRPSGRKSEARNKIARLAVPVEVLSSPERLNEDESPRSRGVEERKRRAKPVQQKPVPAPQPAHDATTTTHPRPPSFGIRSRHSLVSLNGMELSQEDHKRAISEGFDTIFQDLARTHGFREDFVLSIWEDTGSLKKTEEILKRARNAVQREVAEAMSDVPAKAGANSGSRRELAKSRSSMKRDSGVTVSAQSRISSSFEISFLSATSPDESMNPSADQSSGEGGQVTNKSKDINTGDKAPVGQTGSFSKMAKLSRRYGDILKALGANKVGPSVP